MNINVLHLEVRNVGLTEPYCYTKCDRCWNYSTRIGESAEHPLICDRCVAALAGNF
ncbi:hypothetical protein KBT16_24945 [Nostoc sp. CCCryo 231-06]|nr:hypothetical protein [Nostoc sp. CCCryo 231-06]